MEERQMRAAWWLLLSQHAFLKTTFGALWQSHLAKASGVCTSLLIAYTYLWVSEVTLILQVHDSAQKSITKNTQYTHQGPPSFSKMPLSILWVCKLKGKSFFLFEFWAMHKLTAVLQLGCAACASEVKASSWYPTQSSKGNAQVHSANATGNAPYLHHLCH